MTRFVRCPLHYRVLLQRTEPFGVEEIPYRGKGSERMLGRIDPATGKGPKYTITCHGENTLITVAVIRTCLKRLGFTKDDIDRFWAGLGPATPQEDD